MSVLEFMSDHPWLTFFLAVIVSITVEVLFFRLPNRIMRHANIWKHGYPPEHCDADGDFKEEDKD